MGSKTSKTDVKGVCHPAFAPLREAFAEDFASGRSIGASVALYIEGNAVVDLWGGHANKACTRPWECDTIVNVWSACKAWSAVCVLILVDQGKIDVKQPIAKYWPEFGANGKDEVTVEQALSHQAAVVTYRKYLGRADETTWEQLTMELANESLFWELGTETRYHAFTFGVLAGELVRRVSGQTVGAFLREYITTPHGLDMHIGIPEHMDARVADLVAGQGMRKGIPSKKDLGKIIGPDDVGNDDLAAISMKTGLNPLRTCDIANTRGWRGKEFPASGGHTNARALAQFYSLLAQDKADGGARILSKDTITAATTKVTGLFGGAYGLGFNLTSTGATVPGQHSGSFGHGGLGGNLSFGDAAAKMGFAYTMNLCVGGGNWAKMPGTRLQKIAYECLSKVELGNLTKWEAPDLQAMIADGDEEDEDAGPEPEPEPESEPKLRLEGIPPDAANTLAFMGDAEDKDDDDVQAPGLLVMIAERDEEDEEDEDEDAETETEPEDLRTLEGIPPDAANTLAFMGDAEDENDDDDVGDARSMGEQNN